MRKFDYKWLYLGLILVLVFLTLAVYAKIFRADFVYDDLGFIVNNQDIRSFTPFSKFFLSPDIFTGSNYAAENIGGKNWRPVASLAFAIEYRLFGPNPSGFHLVSILLHLANIILVYLLIAKITNRKNIALATAALWALHPVLTEAVSWISNQSSLIFLGFFSLAILAILNYRDGGNKKYFLWISYLFFILSLLTKETALGGIFIFPFIFYTHFKNNPTFQVYKKTFFNSLPFVLIGIVYFIARFQIIGSIGDHALRGGSFLKNLLLAPAVFAKYLALSVRPVNLLVEYSNFSIPQNLLDTRVVFGILFFVLFAVLILFGRKSNKNLGFGAIWFVAFLLPVMQVIPFQDIIGERFLYAPLVGFLLTAVLGIDGLLSYLTSKYDRNFYPIGIAVAILIMGAFFILTYSRNNDWLNSENLWKSVLKLDPRNEMAWSNLSGYYIGKGMALRVVETSENLLNINPENISGNINLGVGLAMMNKMKEAESKLLYVLSKKPDYQPALVNLAVVYQNEGRYEDALRILKKLNETHGSTEGLQERISQVESIIKYNKSGPKYPYVETELQGPAIEGNIVNSGIYGKVILTNGAPFEASLDVFKTDDALNPVISIRTHDDGAFQIPLRPGSYFIKSLNSGSFKPVLEKYPLNIGSGRWLQIKIEYDR